MRYITSRIVTILVATTFAANAAAQTMPGEDEARRIPSVTVTGHGQVAAEPDRARIRIGAVAQAKDASTAQNQVSGVMTAAINAITALGIPKEDLQTADLSLSPVHETIPPRNQSLEEPRVVGYRASNTLQVVVDDLSRIGAVIDAAVNAGANQMHGLSFELKNDLPQRKQALQEAVEDARAEAEALAEAMGMSLAGVIEAHEGSDRVIPYEMGAQMAAMRVDTPVQAGRVQVTAAVSIRYRLAGK